MDFDSPDPDVEKEFPGLFAEATAKNKKDDDDCKRIISLDCEQWIVGFKLNSFSNFDLFSVSDTDHEKVSKKELLLGRRKDKKEKKDRGYATLDGESSPEEDCETK